MQKAWALIGCSGRVRGQLSRQVSCPHHPARGACIHACPSRGRRMCCASPAQAAALPTPPPAYTCTPPVLAACAPQACILATAWRASLPARPFLHLLSRRPATLTFTIYEQACSRARRHGGCAEEARRSRGGGRLQLSGARRRVRALDTYNASDDAPEGLVQLGGGGGRGGGGRRLGWLGWVAGWWGRLRGPSGSMGGP